MSRLSTSSHSLSWRSDGSLAPPHLPLPKLKTSSRADPERSEGVVERSPTKYLLLNILTYLLLLVSIPAFAHSERIYFISHAGAGDPFWSLCFKGVMQAAQDSKVSAVFMAPETPNDLSRQVEILDAAIASRPAAIALTLPNEKAFARSLKKAQELKIPVLAVNSRPEGSSSAKKSYLAYIGMDDYKAGVQLANFAFARGLSKRVILANHQPGNAGLESRQKGIRETLKQHALQVDILDISSDPASVQSILQSHLHNHPEIQDIFCLGSHCVHAVGRYFQEQTQKMRLWTFDLSAFTLQLMKEGLVQASVDQNPYLQGYESVRQLSALVREQKPPYDLNTGSSMVSSENLKEIEELMKKGVR